MLTDIQRKKLTYLFNFLDFDKSKVIQADDFSKVGKMVCKERGFSPETRESYAVLDHCDKFYHRILHDIAYSEEQQVVLDEWIKFFEEQIISGEDDLLLDKYIELLMGYIFGLTDENNDGFISQEEYLNIFTIFGVSPKNAENSFRNIDANADGKLSRYEIKYAIETFLISDDESDPTNWVFGDWNDNKI